MCDEALSSQENTLGTYLDRDITKCLGGLEPVGRPDPREVQVAAFAMKDERSGPLASLQNSSVRVEIFQKDLMAFERSDHYSTVIFLLQCCVESAGKGPSLIGATFKLSTGRGGGFLAADVPPGGAEYTGAAEEGGQIVFKESSANEGIYVAYKTSGEVKCTRAGGGAIHLDMEAPSSGDGATKALSGLVLLCASLPSGLALEISLMAKVRIAARNRILRSVMGKHQQGGKEKELIMQDKAIQLPLMP